MRVLPTTYEVCKAALASRAWKCIMSAYGPLRAFGYRAADSLIQERHADDVVAYLESFASGAAE